MRSAVAPRGPSLGPRPARNRSLIVRDTPFAGGSSQLEAPTDEQARSVSDEGASNTMQQAPAQTQAERRKWVLEDTKNFLATDLMKLFEDGHLTTSRYSPNIEFEDPISKYSSLNGYLTNIKLLRTLFKIDFQLHKIAVTGPDQITARWTMSMVFWPVPWRPTLVFTGRSIYRVDPDSGLVLSHTDTWDAISNNQFLSIEGVAHVIRQVLQLQLTPELETPSYTVLKAAADYELRRYDSYTVASVPMAPGSGPAGGSGFTELAGYIFGANNQNMKMEMTTPVFTRSEEGASTSSSASSSSSSSMQFVMEERFGDVSALPQPNDARIRAERVDGGYWCALRFSGWPLDFEVVQAERTLRAAMLRDGLRPKPGYQLARYNEPTVPPFLRRNEVLVQLEDGFRWP